MISSNPIRIDTLFPGVALITGAASGIGRAVSISFAREGCKKIVLVDRNGEALQRTKELIRAAATTGTVESDIAILVVIADMCEEISVRGMIHKAVERFGGLHYCVNAAGILGDQRRSIDSVTASFDLVNSVNYRGCWLSCRFEIEQILLQQIQSSHDDRPGERGAIVNIASQLGIVSRSKASAYAASKAAVISMTKSDAIDYSQDGIRINCVCPGVIDTPMTKDSEFSGVLEEAIAVAPMNRIGTSQEIADACLFLCSTKASFIQGAALIVDGGYTIN